MRVLALDNFAIAPSRQGTLREATFFYTVGLKYWACPTGADLQLWVVVPFCRDFVLGKPTLYQLSQTDGQKIQVPPASFKKVKPSENLSKWVNFRSSGQINT